MLPVAIGLLLGQIIPVFPIYWSYVVTVVLGAIFIWSRASTLFLFCLIGVLSIYLFQINSVYQEFENDRSYFGTVDQSPRYRKPGEVEVSLRVNSSRVLCKAVYLPWKNIYHTQKNSSFYFIASFRRIVRDLNPFSYRNNLLRKGYSSTCRIKYSSTPFIQKIDLLGQIRDFLKASVRNVLGDSEKASFFLSTTIGERDMLSDRTSRAFKKTGLTHLLVVSGYQVTLVFSLTWFCIKSLLSCSLFCFVVLNIRALSIFFATFVSIIFTLIVGLDGSSARAGVAILLLSFSYWSERGGGLGNNVVNAFAVLLLAWPGCFFEPGIQLTFAALLGIVFAVSRKSELLIFQYLKVYFFVSLATSFVVLCWFNQFSLAGFFLNPIFAPLVSFVSCNVGGFALLIHLIGLDHPGYLLRAVAYVLDSFKEFIICMADIPLVSIEVAGLAKGGLTFALGLLIYRLVKSRFQGRQVEVAEVTRCKVRASL